MVAKASGSLLLRSRTPRRPVSDGSAMMTPEERPSIAGDPASGGRSSGRRTTITPSVAMRSMSPGSKSSSSRPTSASAAGREPMTCPTLAPSSRSRPYSSNAISWPSSSTAALTTSSRSRLAAVRAAMSLSSCVSRVVCCSRANSAALSMASAAAWQIAAAVSSSAFVNVRSAPLSTSSTVPMTRSLTISGRVTQLLSSESRLMSRTAGVSRGSRSDPTTVGRFVSITSRVTAASASGRCCPIHSSSTSPSLTRIRVCS